MQRCCRFSGNGAITSGSSGSLLQTTPLAKDWNFDPYYDLWAAFMPFVTRSFKKVASDKATDEIEAVFSSMTATSRNATDKQANAALHPLSRDPIRASLRDNAKERLRQIFHRDG